MKTEKSPCRHDVKGSGLLPVLGAVAALCLSPDAAAVVREWSFPENSDPALVEKADPDLAFPDGFKATCRFSVDFDRASPEGMDRSRRWSNLFCRGEDFYSGYCAMVRHDGRLLVYVLGLDPEYYALDAGIVSRRMYLLEVYVTKTALRVFLDGREIGGFAHSHALEFAGKDAPLKVGSMGSYRFFGSMPYLRLESLDAVELPPGGPVPLPKTAPRVQPRAEIAWTKTICAEDGRYIGWPTVCSLQNGDVIAVFSGDRDEHVCPWGKVQMVRSSDNGETWSAPKTIANTILDDRDAGVLQMPDGEVIVTWFNSLYWEMEAKKHPDWQRHLEKLPQDVKKEFVGDYLIRSRDNGMSWSRPERLKNYSQSPHGPVLLKDGSLLEIGRITRMARSRTSTNEFVQTVITVSKSTDAGRTWRMICPEIPAQGDENEKPSQFHEPHLCELGDGTLVGMVRYHGPDNCMRITFSRDGGATWTPMAKTPMVGMPPHLLVMPDGRIVCTYACRIPEKGYGEMACVSDDGGKTWDIAHEILLEPSAGRDMGYPSSCLLPDGSILTAYYYMPAPKSKCVLKATKWRLLPADNVN